MEVVLQNIIKIPVMFLLLSPVDTPRRRRRRFLLLEMKRNFKSFSLFTHGKYLSSRWIFVCRKFSSFDIIQNDDGSFSKYFCKNEMHSVNIDLALLSNSALPFSVVERMKFLFVLSFFCPSELIVSHLVGCPIRIQSVSVVKKTYDLTP